MAVVKMFRTRERVHEKIDSSSFDCRSVEPLVERRWSNGGDGDNFWYTRTRAQIVQPSVGHLALPSVDLGRSAAREGNDVTNCATYIVTINY